MLSLVLGRIKISQEDYLGVLDHDLDVQMPRKVNVRVLCRNQHVLLVCSLYR